MIITLLPYEDSYGTEKRPKDVDLETLKQLCCSKAKFIYETKEQVVNELKENEEESLFRDYRDAPYNSTCR